MRLIHILENKEFTVSGLRVFVFFKKRHQIGRQKLKAALGSTGSYLMFVHTIKYFLIEVKEFKWCHIQSGTNNDLTLK